MIKAYSDGIPANGKPVPDGAAMAKIEWLQSPQRRGALRRDRARSANRGGVHGKGLEAIPGHERMGVRHVPGTTPRPNTYKPAQSDAAFAKRSCHSCHTRGAKARDFVFTSYAKR